MELTTPSSIFSPITWESDVALTWNITLGRVFRDSLEPWDTAVRGGDIIFSLKKERELRLHDVKYGIS